MKKKINYLGFLSLLSVVGIFGFFDRSNSHVFTFFVFLSYIGYFYITPDELFKQRLIQSASITLLMVSMLMLGLFIGYLITQNVSYFTNGFWISFTTLIVSFPLVFTFFQLKDETTSK